MRFRAPSTAARGHQPAKPAQQRRTIRGKACFQTSYSVTLTAALPERRLRGGLHDKLEAMMRRSRVFGNGWAAEF
jgi:hypothetical protein